MNFFLLLAATSTTATTPHLDSVGVVTVQSGACSINLASPPAEISVAWTATNFDPAVHVFKVYENDVLKISTTDLSWQKTISGNIENGPYQQWTSDWTYRVEIANAGNGVVLSSITASPWRQLYGACRDMGQPV